MNTWSGQYFGFDKLPEGGFLVALQDTDGDGKADKVDRFGAGVPEKATGGTGIALYNGAVYAEQNDYILKFALTAGNPVPQGAPVKVLTGLPQSGDHMMHPFVIDPQGKMFINSGSESNTCESPARQPGAKGQKPCKELATRAGIWRYDANVVDQKFSPKERYVTGLRNSGGQAFDATGRLFAVQHGRDQLPDGWPKLYAPEAGRELPAEVLVEVNGGRRLRLAHLLLRRRPQVAGAGAGIRWRWQERGRLAPTRRGPVAAFPAHWAPNDVADLQRQELSRELARRCVHRLPWFMESRARTAGWLQRGVPAVG